MSVLVDTSVWSLALRRRPLSDSPKVGQLRELIEGSDDVVLIGSILQEILQAFRSEASFQRIADHLGAFPLLSLDRAGFVAAARLHRHCASKGIAASTVDCQIATAAILFGAHLLTDDQDFTRIAANSDLKLL